LYKPALSLRSRAASLGSLAISTSVRRTVVPLVRTVRTVSTTKPGFSDRVYTPKHRLGRSGTSAGIGSGLESFSLPVHKVAQKCTDTWPG
jgi:FAD/FMN-containing dehydrogenase